MERINNPPNNLFQSGNPITHTPGTYVMGDWLNAIQEELAGVIENAGLTLTPGDYTQLKKALYITGASIDMRYYDSLAVAITAIGAEEVELVVNTPLTLAQITMVPSNISVRVNTRSGGSIDNGNYDLTFNGPFTADDGQVFIGTGTGIVRFAPGTTNGIKVNWFGNDNIAFTKALTSAAGQLVLAGQKTYPFAAHSSYIGDVNLKGVTGKSIISIGSAIDAFDLKGASAATLATTLSANVIPNQNHITLTSVAGISKGMLIEIVDSALWYYDNRDYLTKGELHKIERIEGLDVYLDGRTYDFYSSGVAVNVYTSAKINLSGIKVVYTTPQIVAGAIKIKFAADSVIDNVEVNDSQEKGIEINKCVNVVVDKVKVTGANYIVPGYGIQFLSSYNCMVFKSDFDNCWKGIDFSGDYPSRHGVVDNCGAKGGGLGSDGNVLQSYGFGTHGTAEYIRFSYNTIENVDYGIQTLGANIDIYGNTFVGKIIRPIDWAFGANLRVRNNNLTSNMQGRITYDPAVMDDSMTKYFIVVGPGVTDIGEHFMCSGNVVAVSRNLIATYVDIKNSIIQGNQISFYGLPLDAERFYLIQNYAGGAKTLSESDLYGNRVNIVSGSSWELASGMIIDSTVRFSMAPNIEATGSDGQKTSILQLSELTTINAAAQTDTTIQIPANSIVLGVSVRVTTTIPTAATFTVTGASSGTAFQTGANIGAGAGATDVGTKNCPYLNATAQSIRITPNTTPASSIGRVRIVIHYISITAAIS